MVNVQKVSTKDHPFSIQSNISLKEKSWFKTGGKARYFAQPKNNYDFQEAVRFAQAHQLDIFILGEGANLLIADEGFDGLVINPTLTTITASEIDNDSVHVTASAGLSLQTFIDWCLNNSLTGLEEFSGIPGTIGGSVFINVHYFEFLLSQFLVSAHVIEKKTGAISTVDNGWFTFGYDYSTLHENKHYLLDATFALKRANPLQTAYARGRSHEIIRHRARRYPTSNTCGSFFRNFFEDEVTLEQEGKKIIWIAYYLDQLGIKGQLSYGKAHISHKHANMIVTQEGATSNDVIQIAREMQRLVKNSFGIVPQPECRLIGFKEYPLLR